MKSHKKPETELEPFAISLRIRHASIDPQELTRAFGVQPLHAFRAGDLRAASGQRTGSGRHGGSYWLADLKDGLPVAMLRPAEFPDATAALAEAVRTSRRRLESMVGQNLGMALSVLVTRVLQPQATLLERLRAEEGEVTLLIEVNAVAAEPFTLQPQVLRGLADLGVAVEFEFSGP